MTYPIVLNKSERGTLIPWVHHQLLSSDSGPDRSEPSSSLTPKFCVLSHFFIFIFYYFFLTHICIGFLLFITPRLMTNTRGIIKTVHSMYQHSACTSYWASTQQLGTDVSLILKVKEVKQKRFREERPFYNLGSDRGSI